VICAAIALVVFAVAVIATFMTVMYLIGPPQR
jgi:hypothetical protein